jgi:uncharacterized RDD family membrane protein YckC
MTVPQAFRGEKIGLPRDGRGALAATGPRFAAFVVDALASGLVAALFVHKSGAHTFADRLPGTWSLIPFALDYLIGTLVAGRTLGMYLFGLRMIRVEKDVAVDPWRALVRTALLVLLVPALVFDRDGRGMHDRLTDTAVVRA